MIAVVFPAVDFAVIHWVLKAHLYLAEVVIGAIPPVNALAIGLALVVRRSIRGKLVRPFLAGFVGSCVVVVICYLGVGLAQPEFLLEIVEGVARPPNP